MNGHLFIKIMQIFLLILSLQVINVELCGLVDDPKCLYQDSDGCYERTNITKAITQKCNDTASSCGKDEFCVPSKIEYVLTEYVHYSRNSKMVKKDEYEVKGCVCAKNKNPINIWENMEVPSSSDTKCSKYSLLPWQQSLKVYKMMAMSTFSLTAVCIIFIIIIIFLLVYYQTCKKRRSNRKTDTNANDANGKPSSSQQNGEDDSLTENDQKTDV